MKLMIEFEKLENKNLHFAKRTLKSKLSVDLPYIPSQQFCNQAQT